VDVRFRPEADIHPALDKHPKSTDDLGLLWPSALGPDLNFDFSP